MGYNPTMKNPTAIGIEPSAPERCIISVPIDIPYLMEQRNTIRGILSGDTSMTSEERLKMEHLIGFLDHFIFNVFYVVAEYPTANRTHY